MAWNHRVIRSEDEGGACYAIHEVQYKDSKPVTWTADPVEVSSETRTGLFWVLAVMTEAVAQPVLEVQDGKLVEVEPVRELTDDLKQAIGRNKEYADGMTSVIRNPAPDAAASSAMPQIYGSYKLTR